MRCLVSLKRRNQLGRMQVLLGESKWRRPVLSGQFLVFRCESVVPGIRAVPGGN